ncbi:MAG: biotin--[acetyl-CoA-carboxylase] ligase, partial [Pseudomonadota bacterium]
MREARPHARLSARFGRPTWFFPEIGSTNDEAVRLASEGAPHGALVLAERQAAGRGRLGRTWVSSPGEDLLFSLVLRPGTAPADTPLITLAAGVAVAETVGLQLKWPNDVVGRPAAAATGGVRADGAGAAAQRRQE